MSRMIEALQNGRRRVDRRHDVDGQSGVSMRLRAARADASSSVHFAQHRRRARIDAPAKASRPHWHTIQRPGLFELQEPPFLKLDQVAINAYSQLIDRIVQDLDLATPRVIGLTNVSGDDDAKTSVTLNLSFVAAAILQRRVLVIDANFMRTHAAHQTQRQPTFGLSDVLAQGIHPSEAIRAVDQAGFDMMPAGAVTARAIELLSGRRMDVLLRDLKQSYDLIVLDLPAIDATSIHQLRTNCDASYLVVQMLRTDQRTIDRALKLLQGDAIAMTGCVLTVTDSTNPDFRVTGVNPRALARPSLQDAAEPNNIGLPESLDWSAFESDSIGKDSADTESDYPGWVPGPTLASSPTAMVPEPSVTTGFDENHAANAEWPEALSLAEDFPFGDARVECSTFELLDTPPFGNESASGIDEFHLETLRRLESLQPFEDSDSDPLLSCDSEQAADTLGGGAVVEPPSDGAEVCQTACPIAAGADSTVNRATGTGAFRIPRAGRRLLQSRIANDGAVAARQPAKDPWIVDALAFCGMLLVAVAVLYVAAEVLLWF
jgi:Mrp family chromosome partitioning ATPase